MIPKIKVILYVNVTKKEKQELTSSLFSPMYNGSKNLDMYPFFEPSLAYPYTKLLAMTYDKILEFFFNKKFFLKMMDIGDEYEYKKTNISETNLKNFEFMIQSLFPNGKLSVYSQSMEYYSSLNRPATYSFMGFFQPAKLPYTYIKLNGNEYTVNDVVWLNDSLNHPKYYDVIMSFSKTLEEMEKLKNAEEKEKKKTKRILESFCLDMLFRIETVYKTYAYRRNDRDGFVSEIRDIMETIVETFKRNSLPELKMLRDHEITLSNDVKIINRATNKKKEIQKQMIDIINKHNLSSKLRSNKKERIQMFYELILQNDEILEAYPAIKAYTDIFRGSTNKLQQDILAFVGTYDLDDIRKIRTPYSSSMMPYIEEIKKNVELNDVIEYVQFGSTYSLNENQMNILKNKFPNFQKFVEKLLALHKERVMYNKTWRKVTKNTVSQSNEKITNNTLGMSLFETSVGCLKKNSSCKNIENVNEYLDIGIDMLKGSPVMYEAYLRLNLIDGRMTEQKFGEIKCKYYDDIDASKNRPEKNNDFLNFEYSVLKVKQKKTKKNKLKGGKRRTKRVYQSS